MRAVGADALARTLDALLTRVQYRLPADVLRWLMHAVRVERAPLARAALDAILRNADAAAQRSIPLCQDTGIPHILIESGPDVRLPGDVDAICSQTVEKVYRREQLRVSCVRDPLRRSSPLHACVLMSAPAPRDTVRLSVLVRGGGSENMSSSAALLPSTPPAAVEDHIVRTVAPMLCRTCPPVIVGVGIGGSFERSGWLAKRACFRRIGARSRDPFYARMERRLCERINAVGAGALAFGGVHSAMDVFIEHEPTHIATLPVSVILQCHSVRRGMVRL
jgi:fumarate hydratase subunit alpha